MSIYNTSDEVGRKFDQKESGQTASETLLTTTLVAVAAISLWTIFGSILRVKVAQATGVVAGHSATYQQSADVSNDLQRVGHIRATQKEVTTRGPDSDELRSSFE